MPSITLHLPSGAPSSSMTPNLLPQLLHTPSGLALLEIQGTVQFPTSAQASTQIGKLVFPLYNPTLNDASDAKWMKRVYMYVGKGQRMTGECKKLGKPVAIIRKRGKAEEGSGDTGMGGLDGGERLGSNEQGGSEEELEMVDVVRYKIVFSARPEPISGVAEA